VTAVTNGVPRLLAVGLVALAFAAGCSQQEPGTPTGSGGGTSEAITPRPGGTTTTRSTQGNATVDACSLLPDSDAARLGVSTPGKVRPIFGLPGCSWTASGQFVLGIAMDTKGLGGATGQEVSLPKHKAIQVVNPGDSGGCGVIVEVSSTSSALISVVPASGGPAEQACPRAVEVAKIVDSKLP
jgi:Protein of unknown function (DUF3558)